MSHRGRPQAAPAAPQDSTRAAPPRLLPSSPDSTPAHAPPVIKQQERAKQNGARKGRKEESKERRAQTALHP